MMKKIKSVRIVVRMPWDEPFDPTAITLDPMGKKGWREVWSKNDGWGTAQVGICRSWRYASPSETEEVLHDLFRMDIPAILSQDNRYKVIAYDAIAEYMRLRVNLSEYDSALPDTLDEVGKQAVRAIWHKGYLPRVAKSARQLAKDYLLGLGSGLAIEFESYEIVALMESLGVPCFNDDQRAGAEEYYWNTCASVLARYVKKYL